MSKFSHKKLSEFASEKAVGLSGYLEVITQGRPDTPRTPLYREVEPGTVLARWMTRLKSAVLDPILADFELAKVSKWGPQGGFPSLVDRTDELEDYVKDRSPTWHESLTNRRFPLWDGSTGSFDEWLNQHRVHLFGNKRDMRPRAYSGLVSFMAAKHKLDTNSGLPDFSRRKRKDVWERAIRDAVSGKWRQYPAVIGSRSSRGKTRFIFMFPMSTNLVEASFTYELQSALMVNRESQLSHPGNIFSAWRGFDAVERIMKLQYESLDTIQDSRHVIVGIDYTKMDTTVRTEHSDILFRFLSPMFQQRHRDGLYESLMHVHSIPVLVGEKEGNGILLSTTHGYASGSGWTNFGESLLSYLLHEYFRIRWYEEYAEKIEFGINQVNGDDGVLSFYTVKSDEEISQFAVTIMREFGFDANPDKQEVATTHTVYLQRLFLVSNIKTGFWPGIYPTVQALNTMVYPERYHNPVTWNARMETLRWLMILENCNRHPLFNTFIKYVMKGDRLKLGLSDPEGFQKFLQFTLEITQTGHDLNPSYNRYGYGLRSFNVIKILQNIAGSN